MKKIIAVIMLMSSIVIAIDLNTNSYFEKKIQIILGLKTFKSGEPLSGVITIVNNTDKNISSELTLSIVPKKNNNIISHKNTHARYYIPAFTEQTYEFKNGPSVTVTKDTLVHILAKNRKGQLILKTNYLILAK